VKLRPPGRIRAASKATENQDREDEICEVHRPPETSWLKIVESSSWCPCVRQEPRSDGEEPASPRTRAGPGALNRAQKRTEAHQSAEHAQLSTALQWERLVGTSGRKKLRDRLRLPKNKTWDEVSPGTSLRRLRWPTDQRDCSGSSRCCVSRALVVKRCEPERSTKQARSSKTVTIAFQRSPLRNLILEDCDNQAAPKRPGACAI
jgi:hypothetical protein